MTDPTRWSDAGDSATQTEQLLVRSGQALAMPADDKQAIWNQILVGLPLSAALPAATKTAAAGSGSLLALKGAKTLCVLAAVSGLTAVGYHWVRKPQSRAPVETARTVTATSVAPMITAAPEPITAPARIEVPSGSPTVIQSPPPSRVSLLREESLAVVAARQALRSNAPIKALHLLELAQQRFKKGALTEEREALTIEALAKAGQNARASARAQVFLTNYPRSPHAADVQRFVTK